LVLIILHLHRDGISRIICGAFNKGKIPEQMTAATLSPARQALADHLRLVARSALADHSQNIAKALAEVVRAEAPVTQLQEKLSQAEDQLRRAEGELAGIDQQHADALRDAAQHGGEINLTKLPASAKAEAAVDVARRVVASVKTALAACHADLDKARSALRDVTAASDTLVLAVMGEENAAAMRRWEAARDAFNDAENDRLALREAIGAHASELQRRVPGQGTVWFRTLETINGAWLALPAPQATPAAQRAAVARWAETIKRLLQPDTRAGEA
jgi:chromosome segregation ATPase